MGNGLRSVAMRVRGVNEETEETDEELQNITGDLIDLTKTAEHTQGVSIFKPGSTTEFKSLVDYFREIHDVWDEMTEKQRSDFLQKAFGKVQAQTGAAIIQNFEQIEEALRKMDDAAGSSENEMEIIRSSIDFKLNALKETWIGTFQQILNRDDLGGIIDFLTTLSNGLGGVISQAGLLKTVFVTLGTVWGTKNLPLLSYNPNGGGFSFGNTKAQNIDKNFYGELKTYLGGNQGNWNLKDFEQISSTFNDASMSAKQLAKSTIDAANAGKSLDDIMVSVDNRVSNIGFTFKNLGKSLKNLGGSLLAGIASAGISMVASFAVTELVKGGTKFVSWLHDEVLTNAGEIRRQLEAVDDLANQVSESTKEIESLDNIISEYDELSKKMNDTSLSASELISVKENMLSLQDTLVDSYGIEAENIDLVNGNYNEQLQLLKEIKKQKAQNFLYNPENGAFVAGEDNKSDFQKNLDLLNSTIDTGEAKYSSGVFNNRSAATLEDTFGFDPIEAVKQFKELSISIDEASNGFINSFTLTMDPNTTKEKANEILTNFYAELVRQYPNNTAVSEWYESIQKSFGLDDYDFERAQTARPNIEYAIKQALVDASEDGTTVLDELDTAISNYNKALTEFEVNATETNKASLDRATTALDGVKQKAAELPKNVEYAIGVNGVDYYQQMISDAFDKVQLTTEEKIEHFFDNVTDKTSGSFEEFKKEYQKIFDWGLGSYQKDITNPVSTKFGNIDMDNRQLIQYDEEYLAKHKEALESWFDYDEAGNIVGTYYDYLAEAIKNGEEVIDTVFGTSSSFRWGNQEHEIAFSPILQTENGPVFLSEQNCEDYISSVIDKAAEDGIITADEIIKIDAEGTGFQVGDKFVKGLIAGVDTTGNQKGIHASIIGSLMHFIGDYGALSIAAKGKPKSNIKEYTQEQRTRLTDEERKIFDQSLLSSNAKILTLQDIDGLIKEAKEKAAQADIEMEVKVKASDAVDSMADAKTALNSLEALYDQVVNKTEKEGQATGFADPALINSVESAFSKFVTDDEAGQKLNAALENFEKTLVEVPDDAGAAQDAMDELITAYIDQTDIIKNLTEDNAEWSKAQLTAMGITNAEEVVMTRLNKTSKKLSEGLSKVTETLKANADALQESKQGTTEYEEAIQQLTNDVAEMLSFQSEDGTISFDASTVVDSSFIEAHRADIDAMVEGDIDALNRVRAAAAHAAVMTVMVDMPTEAAEQQVNHIMDMVAQADAMNIDVGASIDDSAFLQALSNMVGQSQTMANAVSKAFETMGYNVKFIPNKYKMRVPSGGNVTTVYGGPDAGQAIHWTEAELDIPSVQITRAGTAGAKATYTPPANTPSGGGGGGGGGDNNSAEPNKPKEEAEETFDWIEVKLQRLQEAEERLSKVVSNTYDIWSKRNKSLEGEIDNVTDQIKAQEKAQDHYLKYADSIQVNGGKGLNDDDYGENDAEVKANDQRLLEEAIQQFDAYKQKVREGLIGEKDIETIQNHFLSEAIKEYQQWYNLSVQAGDAVQDLKIKLGDLAKTRFDNIKSEFDGLIGLLEAKASLIEKRIDKAEAHGYFTDEKYYKQLMANNDAQYQKKLQEYNGLEQALQKAINEGSIKQGSEAWVQMTTDIKNCRVELEELTNQNIEYANSLRQIQWDKFDFTQERISRVASEMEFLNELIANEKMYEDDGTYTDYGQTRQGLYLMQYDVLVDQLRKYKDMAQSVAKDLADDPNNKKLIDEYDALQDAIWDTTKSIEGLQQSVKEHLQGAINNGSLPSDR